MIKKISLDGKWKLSGTDEKGSALSLDINIPGLVHPALEKAGILPEMFRDKNAEKCQWIEKNEWTFTKTFSLADEPFDNARIVFEGIDTYADIYLNGEHIGESRNMFTPYGFGVSGSLRRGKNVLKVVVHPYADFVKDKPMNRSAAFRTDRLYVRRVQCTFWWDWVERFVSAGIWKSVTLIIPDKAEIGDVFVYTKDIAKTSASLNIQFETMGARANACRFGISITSPAGKEVWSENGRVFLDKITLQADIREPELWWPSGFGKQPLYTVKFSLFSDAGELLDEKTVKTGIRTVRFEFLRDEPGSEEEKRTLELRKRDKIEDYPHVGEGMVLLVNGERIFGKGGNWVPPSPFAGTRSAKEYDKLVKLAKDANMNFLRVWGGGEYEPDVFYEACDKYGIMLSHDFMLSCGNYPDGDGEFVSQFRREIRDNVINLRNHPSIVFWSGNNEDCVGRDWDAPDMKNIALLPKCYLPELEALDPSRSFRFGSPYGGYKNEEYAVGDNHGSWWWTGAEKINTHFFDMIGRFTTESPLEGYPLPSTLRRFLSEKEIDPEGETLDYHIKNNYYFDELGWPTVHGRLKKNTAIMLGERETLKDRLYLYSYIQYEWARFTIEGARRGKWYSAALQFWMYNDCWPALGYAVVDYYCRPKAGWYSSRRAFAPIAATLCEKDGKLSLICLSDSPKSRKILYSVYAVNAVTGEKKIIKEGAFIAPRNENITVLSDIPDSSVYGKSTVIFAEIRSGDKVVDRARWYKGWLSELETGEAKVTYKVDREKKTVTVKCEKGLSLGLAFDGNFVLSDNFFDLCEGEEKTVSFKTDEKYGKDDRVEAYAYNADPREIK